MVQAADFIFYRAFDVGHLRILDKIEEKVAGIEGITFPFFLCLLAFCLFNSLEVPVVYFQISCLLF